MRTFLFNRSRFQAEKLPELTGTNTTEKML